jgi:small subunit ribosomal protein S3
VAATSGEVAPEQSVAEAAGPEATAAAENTAAQNPTEG